MSIEKLRYVDRIGPYYYFRRAGVRTPLPGTPDNPDFIAAYERLLRGAKQVEASGTIAALIASYYQSDEYIALRDSTKYVYRGVLERMREKHGHRPFAAMGRTQVKKLLLLQDATPGAANMTLKLLRVLVRHALDLDWITVDPTVKVKKRPEGRHRAWSEPEIELFEQRWPLGSRQRLAFALHLYTGQRRSDVVRMTWRWFSADLSSLRVKQQKTGADITIPVHPDLYAILSTTERKVVSTDHRILLTEFGQPFSSAASYGNWMADIFGVVVGLPDDCVLHGLRSSAGRRLAEAGCGIKEIMAVLGHKTVQQAEDYTKDAEQKALAVSAIARLPRRK